MKSDFADNTIAVAVVGLGYVGLPLALLADRKGHKVIGIDINEEKVQLLSKRVAPFITEEAAIQQFKEGSLEVSSDFRKLKRVSVIIICVPTPVYQNNMPNLEPLEDACKRIAEHLQEGQLVVLESTVNPGVCESIVIPRLEEISGLKAGEDFYLAHCPERINPGDKTWTIENIPRVVGGLNKISLEKAFEFYRTLISSELKPMMSLKEAEAVKIVENTFRDINIAFVNELAMSFSRLGIDVVNVIEGAATKPFAFMPHLPGCGVGGHCIPVDPYYLIEYAKNIGFSHDFLKLARRINEEMPEFTVQLTMEALNTKKMAINGATVALLGLAYKPEIDDSRESPSFKMIPHLERFGAKVIAYDPFVSSKFSVDSLDEALKQADAVIIATAHNDFKKLTPDDFLKNNVSVIIDGRNCLSKEDFINSGIAYKGIGR